MNTETKKKSARKGKSGKTGIARPRPFGQLLAYDFRILLARNVRDYTEFLNTLIEHYELKETPELRERKVGDGDDARVFKYLQVNDLVPIYVMFMETKESATRRVLDVFELTAHLKSSSIVYVTYSAIPLFKLAILNNFPTILFHDVESLSSYVAAGNLGHDEKELLASLSQKQKYVTEEVKTRKEFAQAKKDSPSPGNKHQVIEKEKPEKAKLTSPVRDPVQTQSKTKNLPAKESKGPTTPAKGEKYPYRDAIRRTPTPEAKAPTTTKNSQWVLPVDVAPRT